jgi:hypothetical protein
MARVPPVQKALFGRGRAAALPPILTPAVTTARGSAGANFCSRRTVRVMSLRCREILADAGALLVVLVAAVVSNWSSLTTSTIRSDLADYARAVRRSALSLPDKLRLLDHLGHCCAIRLNRSGAISRTRPSLIHAARRA